MSNHRDTGGQKLGTGGADDKVSTPVDSEADVVEFAGPHVVYNFGLRHGCLEIHVPHRGSFHGVGHAFVHHLQKGGLADLSAMLVDGGVLEIPVDGETECAPQVFEGRFVFVSHGGAGFDEVLTADLKDGAFFPALGLPIGIVRHRRVALHSKQILNPAFGGQAVVVPTHRIADILALHPIVTRQQILVGVAEDVSDMEGAAHRGGRTVDHEGVLS